MTIFPVVKGLLLQPDPTSLPVEPALFAFSVRLLVGPSDRSGEESFDVTVCSPEWVAAQAMSNGFMDLRHHVVVTMDQFDRRALERWLAHRVQSCAGETWAEVVTKVGRLGYWEFEDYTP